MTSDRLRGSLSSVAIKPPVRVATTAAITLAGLQTIDGVSLAAGDRVLVKNQAAAKDNGIWVAAAAGWSRAADADSNAEVTSALLVSVEQGATQADTRWQLITDGVIVLGATALTFQNVTQGFAPIDAPALVNPTANTPPQFDNSLKLATTEFVQRAAGSLAGYVTYAVNTVLTAADVGKYVYANAPTIVLTLPDAALLPAGSRLYIQAAAMTTCTAKSINGNISGPNSNPNGSPNVVLGNGVATEFIAWGTGWLAVGGSGLADLSSNGYQRFPGGLTLQWGVKAAASIGSNPVVFPIAFPNACFGVTLGFWLTSSANYDMTGVNTQTLTGFNLYNPQAATLVHNWLAIGY